MPLPDADIPVAKRVFIIPDSVARRAGAPKEDAYWTPSIDLVDRIVATLPSALAASCDLRGPKVAKRLAGYEGQYVGVVRGGERRVLNNYFCSSAFEKVKYDLAADWADRSTMLEGWLEAHLVDGQVPPRPVEHTGAPKGTSVARVSIRPGLAAALEIRWARKDADLSQGALGKLAGVTQQQIAKLESPDENPSLETLAKVARALGLEVNVRPRATGGNGPAARTCTARGLALRLGQARHGDARRGARGLWLSYCPDSST